MLGSSRIGTKQLEGLCRRLSMALEAGVDVRTVLAREAQRAVGFGARRRLTTISEAISQGASFEEAVRLTDVYFPDLFHALVHVGEQTGHLGETLGQLANHYEGQIRLCRRFLGAIAWPLIELGLSILVIGFLIWIMGVIGQSTGHPIDPLGLGLVGNQGLVIYATFVGMIALGVFSILQGIRRGLAWTKPIQRLVLKLPGIGGPLQTMALARLTWAMHLTFNSGMNVRRALKLSLGATNNAYFTDQIKPIDKDVLGGYSLHDAFADTGAFPPDFLDSLHAAEESGKLVEAMERLSHQYQERAEAAIQILTTLAGFVVWGVIATIIILPIFRLSSFYVGTLRDPFGNH